MITLVVCTRTYILKHTVYLRSSRKHFKRTRHTGTRTNILEGEVKKKSNYQLDFLNREKKYSTIRICGRMWLYSLSEQVMIRCQRGDPHENREGRYTIFPQFFTSITYVVYTCVPGRREVIFHVIQNVILSANGLSTIVLVVLRTKKGVKQKCGWEKQANFTNSFLFLTTFPM